MLEITQASAMESSRIFVRGLPPTFSEDEFKKHFAIQPVTDVKLMAQRRIGYVGYRSADDAAKAVKYFNKSFIRMSRISVEIARPVADAPTSRRNYGLVATSALKANPAPEAAENNPLKRKRVTVQVNSEDPKLAEYLETMKAPSQQHMWTSEQSTKTEHVGESAEFGAEDETQPVSDDEYQEVPKESKKQHIQSSQRQSQTKGTSHHIDQQGLVENDSYSVEGMALEIIDKPARDIGMSDADWLRSRTGKLLDFDDDKPTSPPERHIEDDSPQTALGQAMDSGPSNDTVEDAPTSIKPSSTDTKLDLSTGRLFLRNLPYSVTEPDLRAAFITYGSVEEVHVPLDFQSGLGKGIAYIQFSSLEDATNAFQGLDGKIFQGRLLHILPAAAKRENKVDEIALSKLPLKKQKQIQRKAGAGTSTFNWNSLYMNADAVISSIADRLGVNKSEVLDPTSADAAVKQAQAETHVIQETKAYFAKQGVDLEAFKSRERGDTAILLKNFPYGTNIEELRALLEEHGQVTKLLMPPSGTIAIAEFAKASQAQKAFGALAYRKMKSSVLFLERAPKNIFTSAETTGAGDVVDHIPNGLEPKLSTSDLLQQEGRFEVVETSTLFVRNLSFQTTSEQLREAFKPLDGFSSARVKTKTDPKKPGQILSMGFGFLEFRSKSQAQAALIAMQGYNLDGHSLLIKASHKGLDAVEERKKEDQAKRAAGRRTKIIIKNLPFEASKKDLRTLFGTYGQLRSVRLPKKHDSSTRGFAFADFTTPREAENALNSLRDTHLLGRHLVLDFAAEDPDDAEKEIERMQRKVGSQINKVALEKVTGVGRKKFRVGGNVDDDL